MRKEFAAWVTSRFAPDPKHIFLTGDLGYNALEGVAKAMGPRFVNAGVAEQNMVSLAAGLARQGLIPMCYSIAPFMVFRPAEQIRLDVCIHKLNVKIIGNGGGYAYGIMGASHHALEDLAVLSSFPGMRCIVPLSNEDVTGACEAMLASPSPNYLRLGLGVIPAGKVLPPFAPVRQLERGGTVTIVGIGPVLLNAWKACLEKGIEADLFCVAELPLRELGTELEESLRRTGKLLVVEEHTGRGGLGEHLAGHILRRGLSVRMHHAHALGYPDERYGSQAYHCRQSGLDSASLGHTLQQLLA